MSKADATGERITPTSCTFRAALSIVQVSPRPDLPIKLRYAQQYLEVGQVSDPLKQLYVRSINSFNGFYEFSPRKSSANDFVESFERLLDSFKRHGWLNGSDPIAVTSRGELVYGAHRVAIAASLGLEVPVQVVDEDSHAYSQPFFTKYGFTESDMFSSTMSYLNSAPDARALIVHSNVPTEFDDAIEEVVLMNLFQFAKFSARLKFNAYCNLKYICYANWETGRSESWIGNSRNRFIGLQDHARISMGGYPVRIYIVNGTRENLIKVKDQLRSQTTSLMNAFHTSESSAETLELLQLIAHTGTREASESRPFWKDFGLESKLRNIEGIIGGKSRQDFCFVGSTTMGVYGLKVPSDLDYIALPSRHQIHLTPHAESHADLVSLYQIDPSELIENPQNHLYFRGFKFANLTVVRRMKSNRAEYPKDFADVATIDRFLDRTSRKVFMRLSLYSPAEILNSYYVFRARAWRSFCRSKFGRNVLRLVAPLRKIIRKFR